MIFTNMLFINVIYEMFPLILDFTHTHTYIYIYIYNQITQLEDAIKFTYLQAFLEVLF